jgi:phosphoribosylglycinamide formyltransferase 1
MLMRSQDVSLIPQRVFVIFGGSASAVQRLAHNDCNWNITYKIVGALCSKQFAPGREFFENHDIPYEFLEWGLYKEKHGNNRELYFETMRRIIDTYQSDYIINSGFLITPTNDFIQAFERKIINVHPADLSIVDEAGKRIFTGLGRHAIQKTMDNGYDTICSTVHFVEIGDVDDGEIIAQSRPCRIAPTDTAESVQERLKVIGDPEALQRALRILTQDAIEAIV